MPDINQQNKSDVKTIEILDIGAEVEPNKSLESNSVKDIDANESKRTSSDVNIKLTTKEVWQDKPFVANQIDKFPNSIQQSSFCSKCFVLNNNQDIQEYNSLINRSMGNFRDIIVLQNIVKYSESTGTFNAFVAYKKLQFSNNFLTM